MLAARSRRRSCVTSSARRRPTPRAHAAADARRDRARRLLGAASRSRRSHRSAAALRPRLRASPDRSSLAGLDLPDRAGPRGWPVIFFADSSRSYRHGPCCAPALLVLCSRSRRSALAGAARRARRARLHSLADHAEHDVQQRGYDTTNHYLSRWTPTRPDRLQRHAVLRRRGRDLQRRRSHARAGQRGVRLGRRTASPPSGMEFNTEDARPGRFSSPPASPTSRTAASIAACSARRSPTPISGARRSRSSARRPTRSRTAASPPACSRRRAGSWSASSVTLTLETRACLTNMVLKVKDVPLFYLPVDVLPDQQGRPRDRVPDPDLRRLDHQGQTLSNAFFWAINRSQDATLYHDCYLEDRPGLRRRVPLHPVDRARPATCSSSIVRRARRDLRAADGSANDRTRASTATRSTATCSQRCPPTCG